MLNKLPADRARLLLPWLACPTSVKKMLSKMQSITLNTETCFHFKRVPISLNISLKNLIAQQFIIQLVGNAKLASHFWRAPKRCNENFIILPGKTFHQSLPKKNNNRNANWNAKRSSISCKGGTERERGRCCRFARLFKQTCNNFAMLPRAPGKRTLNGKGGTSAL